MRTLKELFWRHYHSLLWSPSPSPRRLPLVFNSKSQTETESGSRKRHRVLVNSNDVAEDEGESSLISSFTETESGSRKRHRTLVNSNDVAEDKGESSSSISSFTETESGSSERHRTLVNSNDIATKRNQIYAEDKGESSLISSFVCEICIETKTEAESFSIRGCSHSYCRDCVVKYVGSKLDENVINIRCPVPRCSGLLESDDCREVLPKSVFDRWEKSLCNAAVMDNESERFIYCPFKDCSALAIIVDDRQTKSECPNCKREICAVCVAVWHDGITCEEFRRVIDDEDIGLMELASRNKWRRCPYCKLYVEKKPLWCNHIRCRCGNSFCYGCGSGSGSPCFCFLHCRSPLDFLRWFIMR